MGEIASRPLDRARPLWEMWVAEGLEHGRVGIIAKMHHSAIDGASGVDVLAQLVDIAPSPVPVPDPEPDDADEVREWDGERVPSEIEMMLGSVISLARQPAKVLKAARDVAGSVVRVVTRLRNEDIKTGAPFTAPRLPFNTTIPSHRPVGYPEAPSPAVQPVAAGRGTRYTLTETDATLVRGLGDRRFLAVLPRRGATRLLAFPVGNESWNY